MKTIWVVITLGLVIGLTAGCTKTETTLGGTALTRGIVEAQGIPMPGMPRTTYEEFIQSNSFESLMGAGVRALGGVSARERAKNKEAKVEAGQLPVNNEALRARIQAGEFRDPNYRPSEETVWVPAKTQSRWIPAQIVNGKIIDSHQVDEVVEPGHWALRK